MRRTLILVPVLLLVAACVEDNRPQGEACDAPSIEVAAGEDLQLTFTAERVGQFPIELHPADDPQGVELGVFTVHEP